MKKFVKKMVEVQEFEGRYCDLCGARVPDAWECAVLFVPVRSEDGLSDGEIQVDVCMKCLRDDLMSEYWSEGGDAQRKAYSAACAAQGKVEA